MVSPRRWRGGEAVESEHTQQKDTNQQQLGWLKERKKNPSQIPFHVSSLFTFCARITLIWLTAGINEVCTSGRAI